MRLRRLDLIRYGRFTDQSIELPAGEPDLRVIYGPNEAGKSTTRAALTDLLYGFGQSSDYAFLHPYGALRIGAVLEAESGTLDFVRKKGRKNTVLDRDDTPAPTIEVALSRALPNTDLDFFKRMFSLDQERLREGAAQLPGQGGDGDTGLLSAGAGITDLLARRQALAAEADSLWGPREKQSRAYTQAANRLKAAEKTMRDLEVSATQWEKLRKAYQTADDDYEELKKRLRETRAERTRLERIRRVMPHIRRYLDLDEELVGLGEVAALDKDAGAVLNAALKDIHRADAGMREQNLRVDALKERIANTPCDEPLLARAADIDKLVEKRTRITDDADLLTRSRIELEGTERSLHNDAASLRWAPESIEGLIERLPNQSDLDHAVNLRSAYGEKVERADNAAKREEETRVRQQQMRARLEALGGSEDVEGLDALVTTLKSDTGPQVRLEAARESKDRYQNEIDRLLDRLTPSIDEAALRAFEPPAAYEVDAFVGSMQDADVTLSNVRDAGDDAAQTLRLDRLAYEQVLQSERLATEAELDDLRDQREAGWRFLLGQYIDNTAPDPADLDSYIGDHPNLVTAYESAVRAADAAADRRFDKAETAGQLKEKARGIAVQAERLEMLEAKVRKAEETRDRLTHEWRQLWQSAPFEPAPPAAMHDWLDVRAQLLDRISDREAAASKVETLQAGLVHDCERLRTALRNAGVNAASLNDEGFATLMTRAEQLLKDEHAREQERQNLHRDLAERDPELAQRRKSAESFQAQLSAWAKDWAQALARLGLDATLTAGDAQQPLATLTRLRQTVAQWRQHDGAIAEAEARAQAFGDAVAQLSTELASDLHDRSALAASIELKNRLTRARQARQNLDDWAKELESTVQRVGDLEKTRGQAGDTLQELHAVAGTTDTAALSVAIERSDAQRRLRAQKHEFHETAVAHGDGLGLQELINECSRYTPDELTQTASEIQDRAADLESEEPRLLEARNEARDAFESVGGDDAYAVAASERSQAIADMREAAEAYARVGTASILLRWAAQRYRLEKLQPLITRAGEIFSTLTLGSFDKLVPVFEDEEMHIAGRRSDGEAVRVQAMSEGTQDQMFLALRLASLEEYLERGTVLPFVADDLFVNFDDERALAGLRVLVELSKKTQVLFFTHHQHLCDLARQVTESDRCVIHV
ncbi:hypothetical protein SADO_06327 [Salinisphaera dokdonensis CL-ES53]|uniref:YhaN AAA domain-containing protein n=1 Tax=Salinisphaera dokdonensis CL-ES53 TaxID=1304272 RepID=A0ABV2AZ15_9GAMM